MPVCPECNRTWPAGVVLCRDCRVALTPFGLDVVECRVANYPTNPIDDWASGVRLSSADGELWFREDGKLVRVP